MGFVCPILVMEEDIDVNLVAAEATVHRILQLMPSQNYQQ
jgi:hypothetical protein